MITTKKYCILTNRTYEMTIYYKFKIKNKSKVTVIFLYTKKSKHLSSIKIKKFEFFLNNIVNLYV